MNLCLCVKIRKHPSGKLFATSSSDKSIIIWTQIEEDSNNYKQLKKITDAHDRTIRYLAFSPNGQVLASASFDSTICIFVKNNQTFEFVQRVEGHENEVKCVSWSYDSKYLASCSRDKTIQIWDYDNNFEFSCYAVIEAHSQDVKHVKWIPQTYNLASCSFDDTVKIWEQEDDDWKLQSTFTNHQSIVWCVEFSKDGMFMSTCGDDKYIKIFKKNENGVFQQPYVVESQIENAHLRSIFSISFSEDAMFLASGGADNCLNVYQKKDDQVCFEGQNYAYYNLLERKVNCHISDINCVAFSPVDNLLVTVSDDRMIKIWTVDINL
ncbi:hypothetical protein IMG5_151600 [Ichthyophthirius multifiliis]|uniref:Probable cytosolic iron-sulfur protein assembly protein CIAO1 homolog n=1 Tax=Ichthyophthirius multifiliis TaxID=5932 RepID=G0QYQ4_ICHMU|nr:hypothetical protein IMG5_151600 [Ichthyophthirius multifiliis]EGR29658.1 hypothetical protein IMG5_151600 [Ichthyophthirius multifiliis]|eukprot:XP_004030894.1 hypothetical protein IMG5_151600 [Ichthyophthirius multifiliis]